jgi:hypothetical protein
MSEERPPPGDVLCPLCDTRQGRDATICGRCGRYFTSALYPEEYRAPDEVGRLRPRELHQTRRWLGWNTLIGCGILVILGLVLTSSRWENPDAAG